MEYLAVTATEVPHEHLFSVGDNTVTTRRENLTLQHVEQLAFLFDSL